MTKRIIALALAALLSFAMLTACGDKTPAGTDPAATDPAVSGSTDANGGADETKGTLIIGGIGPRTGAAAVYGINVKNGAQIAVDEINAAGGVNGYKLELKFQDDEHDPEKSVNAYNKLMDEGMQVLMGTVTSAPCVAVAAVALEDNMFLLTPSGSAVECVANPNAFRICFSDPKQGVDPADYIAEHKLASKVAVFYNVSDVYSNGIYEKFAAEATAKGIEVVTAQAFTKDSATDFSVQIQKIKESGAELVFLPIYYQEASLFLEQASTAGLNVKYFGCDGLDGIIGQLADKAGLAEGVMLLTPYVADSKEEKSAKFTAAYREKYGETPIQFAADAYDAIYTIKAALEYAKVTDPTIDHSALSDALTAAMTKITVDGVTGTMTWDESGEPNKTPKAMVIQGGTYVSMDE